MGKAGRGTLLEEKTTKEICELASDILLSWFKHKQVSHAKKVLVAKEIFLKRLPSKIEGNGLGDVIKQYVTIYRPEPYSKQDVEAAQRTTDRSI